MLLYSVICQSKIYPCKDLELPNSCYMPIPCRRETVGYIAILYEQASSSYINKSLTTELQSPPRLKKQNIYHIHKSQIAYESQELLNEFPPSQKLHYLKDLALLICHCNVFFNTLHWHCVIWQCYMNCSLRTSYPVIFPVPLVSLLNMATLTRRPEHVVIAE